MSIVEFLLARIAEDERRAEGSGTVAWLSFRDKDGSLRYTAVAASDDIGGWLIDGEEVEDYADCTVIYAESHRLAECAAKRAIVKLHDEDNDPSDCTPWGRRPTGDPCATLRALAAVYADHPDYREEWKP